ncbi:caffeoylshikimate esterase-like [Cucurbita pepo subsp. pepo]|uniref:caffeoylshikimate esterase-like n=1 Tax=Cucurbita pepo subsp. pepo TaxID=3664 RepID=UPI000C9D8DC2|nr:caffeoylshikimate esterase-like [Cucurbita pepo subsp. pepo]
MAHPINQANENSPYGGLTREQFYKKHNVTHHEAFILNAQEMKIFTQSWRPVSDSELKGVVAMVHGYTSDSGWMFELTAVAIAKAGFLVCSLDLQGHGRSDGAPGSIPDIELLVLDCTLFFDSVREQNPTLPAFLYGESLGGAISILICLKQEGVWSGIVLNGSMCGISAKFKPIWPLEKLLPIAASLAPSLRLVLSKPHASKSYKEEWKRRLVAKNPNRRFSGKPPMATALEFLRVCEYIKMNCHEIRVPMLMVHGEDDVVCDSESARFVFESAASKDKTLKVYPGMWHQLIGEANESVEIVYTTIFNWLVDRAEKAKAKNKNKNTKK